LLAAVCGGSAAVRTAPELRHLVDLPACSAEPRPWPAWVSPEIIATLHEAGIERPWSHQVDAAELARRGNDVVISTGTASGKSLAFQLPVIDALARDPRARALYLAPTKALGHDQLRAAHRLTAGSPSLTDVCPASYDGDTPAEIRQYARERARWLFSNPDMIHLSLLRNHTRWGPFLRGLRFVVVDECHHYRGVFGSNVALVLRRLLRLCERYAGPGSTGPTVIFASATTACPGATAGALIGRPVAEVTHDGSPRGGRTIALWEPQLRDDLAGENDAPVRRSAGSEAARMMADLVAEGARTLVFVRSRRGAELTALGARARLSETAPQLCDTIASYRAGYLAEDRRELERALADGDLRGVAGGLPRHGCLVLAAGGPVRPARAGRTGGADRPRRPARHLSGEPPRGVARQTGRTGGDRPGEPVRRRASTAVRRQRGATGTR
jgi:DEAD/DEAH box helicase domain-containing protein